MSYLEPVHNNAIEKDVRYRAVNSQDLSVLPDQSYVHLASESAHCKPNPFESNIREPDTSKYAHESPSGEPRSHLYSLLSHSPPVPSLAIGSSIQSPPTPETLVVNPEFMKIVQWVIRENAANDPDVQAQAALYASQSGSALGGGGFFFPQQQQQQKQRGNRPPRQYGGGGGAGGDGAGGASAQGGIGGGGRGGYIHVSDQRNPPDFGRVAWPEDIFGSLELDGQGQFVDGKGRYQEAGTYRVMTNEGILGLSPFLRQKLVEKLEELDGQARKTM